MSRRKDLGSLKRCYYGDDGIYFELGPLFRNFTIFKEEAMNQKVLHGSLLVLCCISLAGMALYIFRNDPQAPILLSGLLLGLYVFLIWGMLVCGILIYCP
ncbi:hypothetical protein TNIN_93571 [Trichonephila inaurata madagascariensis]|uniref:Uncharacterized protein n=1 Tax=Trichonephila inaurata madagascariensis TaxID=2747483 RepID=A0A8X6WUW2_9ARAC|nr:hypothetical protein TNIN_93571 [Trichonephila inaurata madagascariensis]